MSAEIVMPRLSDSMEEGTVLQWLKSIGDEVAVGDELVEIETDKANMVYESDAAGKLVEIVAEEGETLPTGAVIARVGEELPEGSGSGARAPSLSGKPRDGRVKASPLARRIAGERGLDLVGISGSAPGGRIVKRDIQAVIDGAPDLSSPQKPSPPVPSPSPAPAGTADEDSRGPAEVVELSRLQEVVAKRMVEAKATVPHFSVEMEIDMSRAVAARARIRDGRDGPVPSFNDMVVKAVAIALGEQPRANGSYRDGRLELYPRINVGVAVASEGALVVPTIFDADRKGLLQIATESRALAARVRDGSITPPELSGGTFTVTNLGMYGVRSFDAVINPPQAGILAVGAIEERPVVREGGLASAHLMYATLACDHRILYGADAAGFLDRVRSLLEEPLGLAL